MTTDDDYMTIREVAEYLGRNITTVHKWIYAGKIKAHRTGLMPKSPKVVKRSEVERVKRILDHQDA